MEKQYLIFNGNNFDAVRIALNNEHQIPMPDGKKGKKRGVEVDTGRTFNYMMTNHHPTEDKSFLLLADDTPQSVIDAADEILDSDQMIAQGFMTEEL